MLFNSFRFVVFFAITFPIYFALPPRRRWMWLLATSYYFYMCWRWQYTVILVVTTLIDYFCAIAMERTKTSLERKSYLILSLVGNMGILFSFKYLGFALGTANSLFEAFHVFYRLPVYRWLLPVGISFHTFQSVSYTIDVYNGVQKAERHLGIFALYVVFFPQLVAGPIERPGHMLPQYRREVTFDSARVTEGARVALWGFFKKMVIADRLAEFVNIVYGDVHRFPGAPAWLATWFFAIQIYCDFSGYSEIALGTAKMMGIDLMTNFRFPYFARSIPEFWRRWHISLTTWFRDYVYIPLGGNRVPRTRWIANILIVFLLSGLWHGAAWTFVIWGAIHGAAYLGSTAKTYITARLPISTDPERQGLWRKALQILITFQLTSLAWVFFRADSLADALFVLGHLTTPSSWLVTAGTWTHTDLYVGVALVTLLVVVEAAQVRRWFERFLGETYWPLRWAVYYALIFGILTLGDIGARQFIYFQF